MHSIHILQKYIYIRSYAVLQCQGPSELRASKCAFRKDQNLVSAFIIKSLHSRSPYGDTFDIVDKTSVYEDGSISCMCKVIEGVYK